MKHKFQTQWAGDYKPGIRTEKKSDKPSMTIPDQSMTVAELVERNKRGLPLGGGRVPMYSTDPENDFVPDIAKMDLAEIQEMREGLAAQIAEGKDKLSKIEQNRRDHKMKTLEAEITRLRNSQKNDQTGALAGNSKPVTSNITE